MKLIFSAIIACLVTDKIRITYGDQVCHPEFASECPNSSTCCSKVKCDAGDGKFRCCEDYERKDESLKTFCSVCPTCVDCVWGSWDNETYTYPNGTTTTMECLASNKTDTVASLCGDGLSPKGVTGKKTRSYETEPGPGGNCTGSKDESCLWDCPEHCQWGEWSSWKWDKKVVLDNGTIIQCGNGERTRNKKAEAKHGGKRCDGEPIGTQTETCPDDAQNQGIGPVPIGLIVAAIVCTLVGLLLKKKEELLKVCRPNSQFGSGSALRPGSLPGIEREVSLEEVLIPSAIHANSVNAIEITVRVDPKTIRLNHKLPFTTAILTAIATPEASSDNPYTYQWTAMDNVTENDDEIDIESNTEKELKVSKLKEGEYKFKVTVTGNDPTSLGVAVGIITVLPAPVAPIGLHTFLSNLSDKAKLMAVPLNSCHVSINAAICSGGAAPMSLSAVYASVSLGRVMVEMYEEGGDEEDVENYLDIKFEKLESSKKQSILKSFARLTELNTEEQKTVTCTVETTGNEIHSKLEDIISSRGIPDDDNIILAYSIVDDEIQKKRFHQAKEILRSLNFSDLYSSSNTRHEEACDRICMMAKTSVDAAVVEYHRVLVILQKLQIMRQIFYFLCDQEKSETKHMAHYCSKFTEQYLDDLDAYWLVMKNEVFKEDGRLKVPKLLILGKTGTGKSTFCNVVGGKTVDSSKDSGGFPVSANPDSCTKETTVRDFCYRGNSKRPVTIIDTPGFDDPQKNQDAQIVSDLVDKLKEGKEVHQILIAVNGTTPRLDGSMKAMISIFQGMFGPKIWENIGIVFTKMAKDKGSVQRRLKNTKQTDQQFADRYVMTLQQEFDLRGDRALETYFIDACYEENDIDELEAFERAMEDLWKSISSKEQFETKTVEKVMLENDELKMQLKKKEQDEQDAKAQLEESQQRLQEFEKQELLRIKADQNPIQGYTYYRLQKASQYTPKTSDYASLIKSISPKIHHFDGKHQAFDVDFWDKIKTQWNNDTCKIHVANYGNDTNDTTDYTVHNILSNSKVVFILEINNATKHFLNGDLSCGDQPYILGHPTKGMDGKWIRGLTAILNFNTFVIPPYTIERLIFKSNRPFIRPRVQCLITFSVGNYPPTSSFQKFMFIANIEGKGKNSCAVGFPKQTINKKEMQEIIESNKVVGDYYAKYFASGRACDHHMSAAANGVSWPKKEDKRTSELEISGCVANDKKIEGKVILSTIRKGVVKA